MNIVPHNHDFAREQCIAASFEPVGPATDWDSVIAGAADIDTSALIQELRAGEPFDDNETNRLFVFRLQTKIRIAARHAKGMPQYAKHTCGLCGTRKADPATTCEHQVGCCVHCAEGQRMLVRGMRNDPLRVSFHTGTGTWGIAYTTSDDNQKSAGIIVIGYPTCEQAQIAMIAPRRFTELFNRGCAEGLEVDEDDIVPTGDLFRANLPFNPEQWRGFLSANMRLATPQEALPYASEIREAVSAFFKQEH